REELARATATYRTYSGEVLSAGQLLLQAQDRQQREDGQLEPYGPDDIPGEEDAIEAYRKARAQHISAMLVNFPGAAEQFLGDSRDAEIVGDKAFERFMEEALEVYGPAEQVVPAPVPTTA
ncbi:MAG: hypothetical protein AAF658_07410, partial [Myxococcota bacterium]